MVKGALHPTRPSDQIDVKWIQWQDASTLVIRLSKNCWDLSGATVQVTVHGMRGDDVQLNTPLKLEGFIDPATPNAVVCTVQRDVEPVSAFVCSAWQTEDQHKLTIDLPSHLWFRMTSVTAVQLVMKDFRSVMRTYQELMLALGTSTDVVDVNSALYTALYRE